MNAGGIGTRQRRAGRQVGAHGRQRRRGCTLVELVVALVLCTVGLLAMLGASALLVREIGSEALETRALTVGRSRLDLLSLQECAARSGGSATHAGGLAERWGAEPAVPGVQLLVDSVTYPAPGGTRTLVLRSAGRC